MAHETMPPRPHNPFVSKILPATPYSPKILREFFAKLVIAIDRRGEGVSANQLLRLGSHPPTRSKQRQRRRTEASALHGFWVSGELALVPVRVGGGLVAGGV
jgi:hypothetical protein